MRDEPASFFYRTTHRFESVDSTNRWVLRNWEEVRDGEVVVAATQTDGRGRLDRKWSSPPGNLYLSIVLKPRLASKSWVNLTQVMATAAALTLEGFGLRPRIKWPNDLIVGSRKIGGVLAETVMLGDVCEVCVVGIGLNVNTTPEGADEEARGVTTIGMETGRSLAVQEVEDCLLSDFLVLYRRFLVEGFAAIFPLWCGYTDIAGRRVRVSGIRDVLEGVVQRVDEDGSLSLRLESGEVVSIRAGDVEEVGV